MSENPYLPPSTELGSGRSGAMLPGSGEFDVGRCVSDAWAATWANFPVWLGVLLVGGLLAGLAAVTVIGYFVVAPVILWGWFRYALRAHDGDAEFADLFAGFFCYGVALVSTLGCLLIIGVIGLAAQSIQLYGDITGNALASGVGLVITLVYSLTVAPRLSFAYFYVVDRNLGALEALSQAWADTAPLKLQVVLLALASIAVLIAGALALVVGLFPAMMMVHLMWVSAYRQYGGAPAPV